MLDLGSTRHSAPLVVVLTSLFFSSPLVGQGTLARETLSDGAAIVRDSSSGALWYPHLDRMAKLTKPEQQQAIDALNARAYGGRTNWRFASFAEALELMPSLTAGYTQETVTGVVRTRSPVHPDRYFDPSHPDITPEVSLFCGRTKDEWAAREDLDFSVATRWAEANYHFRWNRVTRTARFDNDLNYIPDEARSAPPPYRSADRPPVEDPIRLCGAWVIAPRP